MVNILTRPYRNFVEKNNKFVNCKVRDISVLSSLTTTDCINFIEHFQYDKHQSYAIEEKSLYMNVHSEDILFNFFNIFSTLFQFRFFKEKLLIIDNYPDEFIIFMPLLNKMLEYGLITNYYFIYDRKDGDDWKYDSSPYDINRINWFSRVKKFGADKCTLDHILSLDSDQSIIRSSDYEKIPTLSQDLKIGIFTGYDFNIGYDYTVRYNKEVLKDPMGNFFCGAMCQYSHVTVNLTPGLNIDYSHQGGTQSLLIPAKHIKNYKEIELEEPRYNGEYSVNCQWERSVSRYAIKKGIKIFAFSEFISIGIPF